MNLGAFFLLSCLAIAEGAIDYTNLFDKYSDGIYYCSAWKNPTVTCDEGTVLSPSTQCPITGCTKESCCVQLCSSWSEGDTCSTLGYTLDGSWHSLNKVLSPTSECAITGCKAAQCCVSLCENWEGPCTSPLILNPASPTLCKNTGCDVLTCCVKPTCEQASFHCPSTQAVKLSNPTCLGADGCDADTCCEKPTCDLAKDGQPYECPSTRPTRSNPSSCVGATCNDDDCCLPPTCGLANNGSPFECPIGWLPQGDGSQPCRHWVCDARSTAACCDDCSSITVKVGGGSPRVYHKTDVKTHNNPLYRAPSANGLPQSFIFTSADGKWHLSPIIDGDASTWVTSLVGASPDGLPLSVSPSTDTWAPVAVELSCTGSQKASQKTCASAGPNAGVYQCPTNNGYLLHSIAKASSTTCPDGDCRDLTCCDECGGMFVATVDGSKDENDIVGLFDLAGSHNGRPMYRRQDGAKVLYFNLPVWQWCIAANLGAQPIACGEATDNTPESVATWVFASGKGAPIQISCVPAAPHGDSKPCVGAWHKTSECTKPCAWEGPGEEQQQYLVSSPAVYGGAPCPVPDHVVQTVPCKNHPCPTDCIGHWEPVGTCSKECGWGKATVEYKIWKPVTGPGGHACEHRDGKTITKPCHLAKCGPGRTSSTAAAAQP